MKTIVICKHREEAKRDFESDVASALRDLPDVAVATVPHLYDLDAEGPGVKFLRSIDGDIVVLSWLNRRAARWVLDAVGVRDSGRDESQSRTIACFDLNQVQDVETLIGRIAAEVPRSGNGSAELSEVKETTQQRWYPVIDYDRCVSCLECLNFCLFGVYDLDEADQIAVVEPDACRNGCPACARVCPNQAIMFPQHEDPAISGSADREPEQPTAPPDDLDDLVDELDDMEL